MRLICSTKSWGPVFWKLHVLHGVSYSDQFLFHFYETEYSHQKLATSSRVFLQVIGFLTLDRLVQLGSEYSSDSLRGTAGTSDK